jgi:hypothetical protein
MAATQSILMGGAGSTAATIGTTVGGGLLVDQLSGKSFSQDPAVINALQKLNYL